MNLQRSTPSSDLLAAKDEEKWLDKKASRMISSRRRNGTSRRYLALLFLACAAIIESALGLTGAMHSTISETLRTSRHDNVIAVTFSSTKTRLFSTPSSSSPKRQPRRNLQKRRRKNRVGVSIPAKEEEEDFPWDTAEARPLVLSNAREAGEDYWIDPEDLRRAEEREALNRARDPGQIPEEKLWIEVLSPYKQNWIGLISVSIIALAFIFKNFPEVIDPPMITNIPLNL